MFYRLSLLINLFGFITTLGIRDSSFEYKEIADYIALWNKKTQNTFINNEQISINSYDILFISIFILIILIFLIGLYYHRCLTNFISNLFSKTKNNDINTSEQLIILHRIPSLKKVNSMYLTVPQPSYLHH